MLVIFLNTFNKKENILDYALIILHKQWQHIKLKQLLMQYLSIFGKKKHFWKARISLVPHDEIGMEVKDELAEEYKLVISNAMINEGNKFLKNPKLKMKAETNIANNWYEAK
jgi:DNA polymerase I-like protein with 3'-5' exonuclease and polymerase domains